MTALLLALALARTPLPVPVGDATDDRARAAFRALSPAQRKDLADYFRLEASRLPTFQAGLIAYVLGTQVCDPAAWPEDAPALWYDSKEHTPENDIPRRPLAPDDPRAKAVAKRMLAGAPPARFASAWRYDPGTSSLRRAASWKDPERIFENGLAGIPPDLDLAEALVERALDDGSQRAALAALSHAYTDRDGNVYPGVTLYDAWGSGLEIEMPDVDALGIVHEVLGDWETWRAPVPAARQRGLYERIGEIVGPARAHRELRRGLAASYLRGSPSPCGGYETYLDNLHALWEDCRSTPGDLARRLPAPEERAAFLEAWTRRCHEDGELFQRGLARRRELDAEPARVREVCLRALAEFAPAPAREPK